MDCRTRDTEEALRTQWHEPGFTQAGRTRSRSWPRRVAPCARRFLRAHVAEQHCEHIFTSSIGAKQQYDLGMVRLVRYPCALAARKARTQLRRSVRCATG